MMNQYFLVAFGTCNWCLDFVLGRCRQKSILFDFNCTILKFTDLKNAVVKFGIYLIKQCKASLWSSWWLMYADRLYSENFPGMRLLLQLCYHAKFEDLLLCQVIELSWMDIVILNGEYACLFYLYPPDSADL